MAGKQKKQAPIKKAKAKSVVKVALLGFGTVGSSVARVLAESKFPGLQLTHIFNRNVERKRRSPAAKFVPASVVWTDNIDVILRSDVDIVVELMGGLHPIEDTEIVGVLTYLREEIAYPQAAIAAFLEREV